MLTRAGIKPHELNNGLCTPEEGWIYDGNPLIGRPGSLSIDQLPR